MNPAQPDAPNRMTLDRIERGGVVHVLGVEGDDPIARRLDDLVRVMTNGRAAPRAARCDGGKRRRGPVTVTRSRARRQGGEAGWWWWW